ncbi:hypothetical protein [Oceanicoccus sp. KOV_DT_Chl]|uniref:hypothetical protein n=1 Tax=Oceanicoccus sp. KOV_DT_Chl TaxID=1904639 RepID=UPI000C7AC529|nr:hypothetical protein [Oceanicoccus sp. KOV_DT_Chl]
MSEKKNIDLNLVELVNLAAKILDQMFIKASKEKAKPIFKELKQGKAYPLGKVKIQDIFEPNLVLTLDYSEFCGPGFNYDIFVSAINGILAQISQKFRAKADLNIMSNENNSSILVHLPGMVQLDDQLNVMVMAFELGDMKTLNIKLMFVEPSQYDAARREAKS